MGINTTRKDAKKTADENLEKKLAYESEFNKNLKTYFEQLAEDYRVIYSATGRVLTMTESYQNELDALLKKNYRNIASDFGSQMRNAIDDEIDFDVYEKNPEEDKKLRDAIAMVIGAYLLLRGKKISPRISETIQNEMQSKTQDYIEKNASLGKAITQAEVANEVSNKIKDWGVNHAKTIATTEVQAVAEQSKNIEISEINNLVQAVDSTQGSRKVWITAGDEKVRASHRVLDGASINSDQMFVTGNGSTMMYAGDMEHGAPLSDVINCRCTTVYKMNNEVVNIYKNTIFRKK